MQKKELNKKGLLALVLVLTMVIGSVAMITAADNAYAAGTTTVSFHETGLATGTNWIVELVSGPTFIEKSSATTYLNVSITVNGSYSFSVINPDGYSGSPSTGTVSITDWDANGTAIISESITFTPTAKTYPVTFYTGTGNLTAGQVWSVTVNGITQSSNTNTVGPFNLENGTYSFTIPDVGHYYATPFKGAFTVAGNTSLPKWMKGTLQNNITFSYGYTVSFEASKLPLYVPWSVTLNGVTNSTTGSSAYVDFSIKNGNYSYSINIAPDWTASPSSGTLDVSGNPVNQTITFTEVLYKIIFVETGLPSGTAWIININGVPYPTTNGTVILTEHNGSYSYSAESMPGYTASPASGTVALGYNDVTVHIIYSTSTVKSGSGNGTGGGFSLPTLTTLTTFFHSETGIVTIALVAIIIIGLVVVAETRGHENKGNHSKHKTA